MLLRRTNTLAEELEIVKFRAADILLAQMKEAGEL